MSTKEVRAHPKRAHISKVEAEKLGTTAEDFESLLQIAACISLSPGSLRKCLLDAGVTDVQIEQGRRCAANILQAISGDNVKGV